MLTEFTPISASIGGALIGIASAILLVVFGKVAGISGTVQALLSPLQKGAGWKLVFVTGLLLAGIIVQFVQPELLAGDLDLSPWLIVVSGLLVGVGTSLANGCTSGHGVCGMSRFSGRSWVATITFMVIAFVTANAMYWLG
ncbi:YeeE/YedE family protein [Psychrosphaera aestuarii]|uniref:YeeE/YedE family protein n=1 Tax=Psychrosphaera aestuarii TaxID=1266052 RepID=UPI001B336E9D|nr:YeeE/YedE thiosulfate transporter family protein [Psychrosphaera aestuarii]